jgi:hypothetical protein
MCVEFARELRYALYVSEPRGPRASEKMVEWGIGILRECFGVAREIMTLYAF